MGVTITSWDRGSCRLVPLVPYPERRPVTRTRAQWAELVALWYAVHGSTALERLRLLLVVWWLGRRQRLEERCTIGLNPEALGVRFVKPDPPPAPPCGEWYVG